MFSVYLAHVAEIPGWLSCLFMYSRDYSARVVNPVGAWGLKGKEGVGCLSLGERGEDYMIRADDMGGTWEAPYNSCLYCFQTPNLHI